MKTPANMHLILKDKENKKEMCTLKSALEKKGQEVRI